MLADVRDAFVGDGELTERHGAWLVAGAGVVFSCTAIVFAAVDDATDMQFLTVRGFSTALAMLLIIALRRRGRPVVFDGLGWRTWVAAAILAGTSMLYILALSRTSAATTLFLLAAAPVFAAAFGWSILRERLVPSTVLAIAVSAVGVAITVGAGLDVGSGTGLLFAALIPVAIGFYNALMRSSSEVDPVVPTLIAGALLGSAAALAALATDGLGIGGRDALLAVISGGLALGIGLPMYNLGHRAIAAARVPLLMMTEVVLAPFWVWIWPGETPSVSMLIGGAVILGAVLLLLAGSPPDEPGMADPDQGAVPVPIGRPASVDHPDHDPT